mmetsp:Transcript_33327/g.103253  ORF Transcript_33327/g.103253 Transcript_33327/m.103253 type:complete len:423 (-) Transcript_33327:671-1939(-)
MAPRLAVCLAAALAIRGTAAVIEPQGQLVLGRGRSPLLTPTKLGPENYMTNPLTEQFVGAVMTVRQCGRAAALAHTMLQGVKLVVALRSQGSWLARNGEKEIPGFRAYSLGSTQWIQMATILVYYFDKKILGGRMPKHAAVMARLFMAAMTQLYIIDSCDPYSVGSIAEAIGITAVHVGLFAMELAMASPEYRYKAARLASSLGLGALMAAACIFGTWDDVIAIAWGGEMLRIVGNRDAYDEMQGRMPSMHDALRTTVNATTLMVRLYRTCCFSMGLKFANSGFSLIGESLVRGSSPWLILSPLSLALLVVSYSASCCFSMSNANFGLVYESQLIILVCIATKLYNKMAIWEPRMATNIELPEPRRDILRRGMDRLCRFLFRKVKPEPKPKPPTPKPQPKPKPPRPSPTGGSLSSTPARAAK